METLSFISYGPNIFVVSTDLVTFCRYSWLTAASEPVQYSYLCNCREFESRKSTPMGCWNWMRTICYVCRCSSPACVLLAWVRPARKASNEELRNQGQKMKAYAVYKHDLSNASGVQRLWSIMCDFVFALENIHCVFFHAPPKSLFITLIWRSSGGWQV